MAENETPSGGLLDQREALVAVARAMWDVLPDEYDSVTCTAMVMGGFGEYQQQAHSTEDSKVIGASYPLIKAVTELRRIMYRPQTGTWYTATFRLVRPGQLETHFDYDSEPEWTMQPSDDSYRQDAEAFPRSPEHTPDWMRAKLQSS